MNTIKRWLVILALTAASAQAGEHALKVGDPAPKLQTGKWVKGEPVTGFEPGTAYLVEFWATWCVPCQKSIPHLTELQEKYQDRHLVVIGQDCSEDNEKKVNKFVKEMGAKMNYRVALDDHDGSKEGKMNETWMLAAERYTIPSAVLVDTHGVIAWIGHPLELKQSVLEDVLDGKYDVAKAAAEYQFEKKYGKASGSLHERGWIGGNYVTTTSGVFTPLDAVHAFPHEIAKNYRTGILVTELMSNTPAALAGLREGDLIIEAGHAPVGTLRDFRGKIDQSKPGSNLPLTVWRNSATAELKVTVGREKYESSWALDLLHVPAIHLALIPNPGFSWIGLGYEPSETARQELGSAENQYRSQYQRGSLTPMDQGWSTWLATIRVSTGKRIFSQEIAPPAMASPDAPGK
ncbi:MAG TPA: redoxin family protein [Verrucomicrobiae bacterium]|nr:redoxin family protein [Verrucomicrobiae bacterium]